MHLIDILLQFTHASYMCIEPDKRNASYIAGTIVPLVNYIELENNCDYTDQNYVINSLIWCHLKLYWRQHFATIFLKKYNICV
jgi:hypothetical protein